MPVRLANCQGGSASTAPQFNPVQCAAKSWPGFTLASIRVDCGNVPGGLRGFPPTSCKLMSPRITSSKPNCRIIWGVSPQTPRLGIAPDPPAWNRSRPPGWSRSRPPGLVSLQTLRLGIAPDHPAWYHSRPPGVVIPKPPGLQPPRSRSVIPASCSTTAPGSAAKTITDKAILGGDGAEVT